MSESVKIGTVWDIKPGERKSVWAEGTRVLILNIGGKYYAIDDSCPHRQCSMEKSPLKGTVITCPCHSAQFELSTGEVLAPPTKYPPTPPLPVHQVTVKDGDMFISLSTDFDSV